MSGAGFTSNFAAKYSKDPTYVEGRYGDTLKKQDRHDYSFTNYDSKQNTQNLGHENKRSYQSRNVSGLDKSATSTAYEQILARKEAKPFRETRDKDLH